MSQTPHTPDDDHDTVNRESHPNAGGPQGLDGDMGISSERTGPFEGIEGTGSSASVAQTTDGENLIDTSRPEDPDPEETPSVEGQAAPDKPDRTAAATNVDRTQGEVQPDPVAHKHEFDPERNPGH